MANPDVRGEDPSGRGIVRGIEGMPEQDLYRELVAWLRSRHPLVFAQWERERKRVQSQREDEKPLPQVAAPRSRAGLDRLSPNAGVAEVVKAIQLELESLGMSGTPGVTPDGAPCVHLIKKGVYGTAYEESVTLARLRDSGYRRHLKQVFG